jgi:peptide-methionine (S)-S-oxide reductase
MSDTGTITRTPGTETAVLAGGCFWGMEDLIRRQPGVQQTRVGYTGGSNDHATYRNHPGHAEAVEIVFDPTQTTYRDILAFFFQIHDPSTLDRQGNDIGSSYRSAIFPLSPEQERVARETIADVDASGLWPGKAVTTIEPEGPFWEAEPEHQDYLLRIPNGYTCHFPRAGWVLPQSAESSARGVVAEADAATPALRRRRTARRMSQNAPPSSAMTTSQGSMKPSATTMPLSVATSPFQPALSPSPNPAGSASTLSCSGSSETLMVDIVT